MDDINEEVDIFELLDSDVISDQKGTVIDSTTEKEFSYRLLTALIPSSDLSSTESEEFTLEQIINPQECLAEMLPTAEMVIAHMTELYPNQFRNTKEVLKKRTTSKIGLINPPKLDELISDYFEQLL